MMGRGTLVVYLLYGRHAVALYVKPFAGMFPVALLSWDGVGDAHGRPKLWEAEIPMKRRAPVKGAEKAPHLVDRATKMFQACGHLVAHLTTLEYEDGTNRKPGWFTVSYDEQGYCVTVKDPDSAGSLRIRSSKLDDALRLANDAVGAEDAPWQPDEWLLKKLPKGKRK